MLAFTGRPASTPISTFTRSSDSVPQTLPAVQGERSMQSSDLIAAMEALHTVVEDSVTKQHERMRIARHRSELPNFREGDYFLVTRDGLNSC